MPKGIKGFQKGHKINTGRKFSKEHKKNLSLAHKEQKGYWKGKKLSKETKEKMRKAHLREKSHLWKGGQYKTPYGYMLIFKPEHPFCNCKGYVRRSRFVMEKHLGRYLKSKEQVHHINKIKDDDRIENLMAFASNSAHRRFHHNPDNVKPSEIIFDGRTLVTSLKK